MVYKHDPMRVELLESIRKQMGMDKVSMAVLMGMPYPTYRDKSLGLRPIHDTDLEKARQCQDHDRETMTMVVNKAVDRMMARFPLGIPSEKLLDTD